MTNNYTFTTEIPEGGERRIHLNYAKTEFIDCGAIIDKITANDGKSPTTYGFLKGVINTFEVGEHLEYMDAFFAERGIELATSDSVSVRVIATFEREDGDHKVLVVNVDSPIMEFADVDPELQSTLQAFHGFHKKITKILNAAESNAFLETCDKE